MFEAPERSIWNVNPRNLLPSYSFPCKYGFQSAQHLLEIYQYSSWCVLFVFWQNCVRITALFDLLPGWCNATMIFRTRYFNVLNPVYIPTFIREYSGIWQYICESENVAGKFCYVFFALPIGLVTFGLVALCCSINVTISSWFLFIVIGSICVLLACRFTCVLLLVIFALP